MNERPIYIPVCLLISLATFYLTRHPLFVLMVLAGLWVASQAYEWYKQLPVVRVDRTYSDLLKMARGNTALVERLITYEQARYPNASRAECVESALSRWQADQR